MKATQYQKVNRDVLLEWTYDDSNFLQEPYKILNNQRDLIKSYVSSDTSVTKNILSNQLFRLDVFGSRFTKVSLDEYPFLTTEEFVDPEPVIHDKLKIYFPSNWAFGEYQGIYLRLYTFDSTNKKICELSNFFFDVNSSDTSSYLATDVLPGLEYQERVWNKFIEIQIPSLYHVSRVAVDPTYFLDTSVNFKLSDGIGLSKDAPIFVDFRFIARVNTFTSLPSNYTLTNAISVQFPQRPETEGIKLVIQESTRGDFFEIFGTIAADFGEFVDYLNTSQELGRYYGLEFTITVFEDNRAGKSLTYNLDENYTEIVEFRPILRYSSSSATIDVEMRIIDKDSGQINTKKAVYGMKPEQLSKYSLNLKRINVRNVFKPKIYQKIRTSDYDYQNIGKINPENKIDVPVPVLRTINQLPTQIVAYSRSALNTVSPDRMSNFHPIGAMKIAIKPFDNLINFTLYLKTNQRYKPFDLTDCRDIKLVFKIDGDSIEFDKFSTQTGRAPGNFNIPSMGIVGFKVREADVKRILNIYNNGGRLFYITCTNQNYRMMIYSGLFTVQEPVLTLPSNATDQILIPGPSEPTGVALVSRKLRDNPNSISKPTSSPTRKNTTITRSVRPAQQTRQNTGSNQRPVQNNNPGSSRRN
jgi:hypothetical protein